MDNVSKRKATKVIKKAPKSRKQITTTKTTQTNTANTLDNVSLKNVHSITKELIVTLTTIEKSLELMAKLLYLLKKHNINPAKLNNLNLANVLTNFDPSQLDKVLRVLQSLEIDNG